MPCLAERLIEKSTAQDALQTTLLQWRVAQKLALEWSPEQISGWLKREFPADEGMQVSHETIYRSLFVQTRGVLKKELMPSSPLCRINKLFQGRQA